jgi:hypothetical protein
MLLVCRVWLKELHFIWPRTLFPFRFGGPAVGFATSTGNRLSEDKIV